jgi:hypothetical protein
MSARFKKFRIAPCYMRTSFFLYPLSFKSGSLRDNEKTNGSYFFLVYSIPIHIVHSCTMDGDGWGHGTRDAFLFASGMKYLVPSPPERTTFLDAFLTFPLRSLNRHYRNHSYTTFWRVGRAHTPAIRLDSLYYVRHLVQQSPPHKRWFRQTVWSIRFFDIAEESMFLQRLRTCPHAKPLGMVVRTHHYYWYSPLPYHTMWKMSWFKWFRSDLHRWHGHMLRVFSALSTHVGYCTHPYCSGIVYSHMNTKLLCSHHRHHRHHHHHHPTDMSSLIKPPTWRDC